MYKIEQITADVKQKRTVKLPDGTSFVLRTEFIPQQQGWFIVELTYGSFSIFGRRIVNSPNMLHQYRNQIPFGIACFSERNREPMLQRDFSSGASQLFVLTQAETLQFQEFLSGS